MYVHTVSPADTSGCPQVDNTYISYFCLPVVAVKCSCDMHDLLIKKLKTACHIVFELLYMYMSILTVYAYIQLPLQVLYSCYLYLCTNHAYTR